MPLLLALALHTLAVILKIRLPPHQRILQILLFGDQLLNLIRARAIIGWQRIRPSLIRRRILRRIRRSRETLLREISILMLFV
jgi:hypothetical protein